MSHKIDSYFISSSDDNGIKSPLCIFILKNDPEGGISPLSKMLQNKDGTIRLAQ